MIAHSFLWPQTLFAYRSALKYQRAIYDIFIADILHNDIFIADILHATHVIKPSRKMS